MMNESPIPRNRIRRRRILSLVVAIAICGSLAFVLGQLNANLLHASFVSGYVLLGSLLFLTAFHWRKKLAFLPRIGSAAAWMQLHIYVGLSTFVVFGCHISWTIPNGQFESLLAALYLIVALSGVYGLYITRRFPKRLTAVGEEVIFERIPALRSQLARDAKQVALGSFDSAEVIPRFYLNNLLSFFEQPRGIGYWLFPTGRRRRHLVSGLSGLKRYLSVEHRQASDVLSGYVERKDDLDYHFALQGRLKLWLFLHVGFTYSLLTVSVMHGLLVHAFIGGGL